MQRTHLAILLSKGEDMARGVFAKNRSDSGERRGAEEADARG